MSIYYDMRENPNPEKDGNQKPLHPRAVSKGTIKADKIVDAIAQRTGFSRGEIQGVLEEYTQEMLLRISEGYNVEWGTLGTLSPKLKAKRQVMAKSEIRSPSISVSGLNFKGSAWLSRQLNFDLERSESGFNNSTPYGAIYRRKLLEQYLDENPYIKRTDYSKLTGQLKNKAIQQLNEYVEQGVLIRLGRGNQTEYRRATQPAAAEK